MRRKLFVICFSLTIGIMLSACAIINENSSKSEEGEETFEQIEKEIQIIVEPMESLESSHTNEYVEDVDNVEMQDKVFEGCYFDESVYQYNEIMESESPLVYCEIIISNVTNTSFDFSIYEKVMATGESTMIVPLHTAIFIEGGIRAAYYGEDQNLYFTFPDEKESYPKHIEILGIEKMEGKTYINNTIAGHESG